MRKVRGLIRPELMSSSVQIACGRAARSIFPAVGVKVVIVVESKSTAETDRIRTMKAKSPSKSLNRNPKFAAGVERALIRAEEAARRAARMYGTPLYVWENGKVVAKRP